MILRSGRMIGNDSFTIDFDEASREWKKNKQSIGQGMYRYTFFSHRDRRRSRKR